MGVQLFDLNQLPGNEEEETEAIDNREREKDCGTAHSCSTNNLVHNTCGNGEATQARHRSLDSEYMIEKNDDNARGEEEAVPAQSQEHINSFSEMQGIRSKIIEESRKIFDDHEQFKLAFEIRKEQLELREKDLEIREASHDNKIIELRRLKRKRKRETEELCQKMAHLQNEIDLEPELEQLGETRRVIEHMDKINKELMNKEEEFEGLKDLHNVLIVKEVDEHYRDELNEALKNS